MKRKEDTCCHLSVSRHWGRFVHLLFSFSVGESQHFSLFNNRMPEKCSIFFSQTLGKTHYQFFPPFSPCDIGSSPCFRGGTQHFDVHVFWGQAPCVKVGPGICHLSPVVHSTFDPGNWLTSPLWPRPARRGARLCPLKGLMSHNFVAAWATLYFAAAKLCLHL